MVLLPIADCRLPIADCRLPIADCSNKLECQDTSDGLNCYFFLTNLSPLGRVRNPTIWDLNRSRMSPSSGTLRLSTGSGTSCSCVPMKETHSSRSRQSSSSQSDKLASNIGQGNIGSLTLTFAPQYTPLFLHFPSLINVSPRIQMRGVSATPIAAPASRMRHKRIGE